MNAYPDGTPPSPRKVPEADVYLCLYNPTKLRAACLVAGWSALLPQGPTVAAKYAPASEPTARHAGISVPRLKFGGKQHAGTCCAPMYNIHSPGALIHKRALILTLQGERAALPGCASEGSTSHRNLMVGGAHSDVSHGSRDGDARFSVREFGDL